MQDPWIIKPQTGGTVHPTNVVGRDAVIAEAREMLGDGTNLLVVDPRRMGKTSMLARLCHLEDKDGELAVMLSYEGVATLDEFLARTVKALVGHAGLGARIRDALKPIVEISADGVGFSVKAAFKNTPPDEILVDVLERAEGQLKGTSRLIVVMDEVPLAIRNIVRGREDGAEAADRLLQKLRQFRSRSDRLQWVVCGSIGFHHVLRSANTTEGVIGDLHPLLLGELDDPGAHLLARCLLKGIERTGEPEVLEALAHGTGRIPFLMHHVFLQLALGAGPVGIDEANDTIAEFISDRDKSKAMTHLVTRLDDYPEDVRGRAHKILSQVAVEGTVATAKLDQDGLNECLDLLVDDHYLVEREQSMQWRYDVLRRIWVARNRLSPKGGE